MEIIMLRKIVKKNCKEKSEGITLKECNTDFERMQQYFPVSQMEGVTPEKVPDYPPKLKELINLCYELNGHYINAGSLGSFRMEELLKTRNEILDLWDSVQPQV
jgi:hypothetical protein